jgi:hypothetical protein
MSNSGRLFCVLFLCAAFSGSVNSAEAEGKRIKKSPLDKATIYQPAISRSSPVRVRPFPTENADLGTGANPKKPKYQEIARQMQEEAPDLLLEKFLVQMVKYGFKDVSLLEGDEAIPDDALVIVGEFTVLNPGSQGKRYGVGFGAGKSRICAEGRVIDKEGKPLMDFEHCRHASMGFFGGNSEAQMTNDSSATGSHLAEFLNQWADGRFE